MQAVGLLLLLPAKSVVRLLVSLTKPKGTSNPVRGFPIFVCDTQFPFFWCDMAWKAVFQEMQNQHQFFCDFKNTCTMLVFMVRRVPRVSPSSPSLLPIRYH
jgi:hypothetical protein